MRKYKLGFLIVMASFGFMGPIVKSINLPTPVLCCIRAVIAAIALWAFILIGHNKWDRTPVKKNLLPLIVSGALIAGGDWIGLFAAYKYTTIATATVIYYTSTILVILMSAVLLKEKFTLKNLICVLIAFTGLALVSGIFAPNAANADFRGIIFAILGAVSYALLIIINKKYPAGDPVVRTAIQLTSGSVATLVYVLISYRGNYPVPSGNDWIGLLVLGIVFTAFAYIFYFDYIVKIPSRSVAIISYADPVVACLVSVFFLSEPMTVPSLIGSIMIIGASLVSEL